MAEKSEEEMAEMVKAVNENPAYKVLTKEEYDLLVGMKEKKVPGKLANIVTNLTSTPAPPPSTPDVKPKTNLHTPGLSPVGALDMSHNMSCMGSGSYPPKLPIFSG